MKVYTDEKVKEEVAVRLICSILYGVISQEELKQYPPDIINMVDTMLNNDVNSNIYDKILLPLTKSLTSIEINRSSSFSLEKFLALLDDTHMYRYSCAVTDIYDKAALGLIMPEDVFYCNVPLFSNHAEVTTQYYQMEDPSFPDLRLKEGWHEYVMKEKKTIIIHFLPNEYGEAIYIPDEITEFQYNELLRINELLKYYNIESATNYKNMNLDEALNDEEFITNHVRSNGYLKAG